MRVCDILGERLLKVACALVGTAAASSSPLASSREVLRVFLCICARGVLILFIYLFMFFFRGSACSRCLDAHCSNESGLVVYILCIYMYI
jgi:hypothetical protein